MTQERVSPADGGFASGAQELGGDQTSSSLHIVPMVADQLADLDAFAKSLRGYLVVQVVVDDAGHKRTTVYRSAGAAQRAVERARERGRAAHVTLCQLLPVGVVQSLGVA